MTTVNMKCSGTFVLHPSAFHRLIKFYLSRVEECLGTKSLSPTNIPISSNETNLSQPVFHRACMKLSKMIRNMLSKTILRNLSN